MRHFCTAAILIMMLGATSASAAVVLSGDNGGKMEDYAARFQQVRDSGDSVIIDGNCFSACTMVLGLVPRQRICATPNAVLGFHAAWTYDKSGGRVASPTGTNELMKTYPAPVLSWIARHGGLTPNMKFVRGPARSVLVRPCVDASLEVSAVSVPPFAKHPLARVVTRASTRTDLASKGCRLRTNTYRPASKCL